MTTTARAVLLVGAALVFSRPAAAQTPTIAAADMKQWDVTGSVGWLSGNKAEIAQDWNDWYDTFAASIDVGRYWTPHVKTEAGLTVTTAGTVFGEDPIVIPNQPFAFHRFREHEFRLTALSLAASYQFFENAWIHPFVTAGAQLAWEHERSFSPEQVIYSGPSRTPVIALREERHEDVHVLARPFAGGGLKFYVGEKGFVRTDLAAAAASGRVASVVWRIGFGVDF